MEAITQYIPTAISAVLLATLILTVATNIIVQVLKKLTWGKIPTNILAVCVAMAVTLVVFFAVCQIMRWSVVWYMVAGAVALGLFVSYSAMFGFDKLKEALEQISTWTTTGALAEGTEEAAEAKATGGEQAAAVTAAEETEAESAAEKMDKTDMAAVIAGLYGLTLAELKASAETYGIDTEGMGTKKEVIQAIVAAVLENA